MGNKVQDNSAPTQEGGGPLENLHLLELLALTLSLILLHS
jgi:hypothetical protein